MSEANVHVCSVGFRSLALMLFLCGTLNVTAQDTLHVVSHDRATVVTDPAVGVRSFPARVAFPQADRSFRKVLLSVRFGCPDGMRCADWDYLDRVLVHRIGTADTFEVARMLTPYGGRFAKDWSFTWSTDLTDLGVLLRDSCTVIYEHSGFEPSHDRGWAVTLDFAFIPGPPAAEVLEVRPLYAGNFKYGDPDRSIEADLVPRAFLVPENAAMMRIRILQTGHGMHEDDGCGEFCAKQRHVIVDGDTVNTRSIWKECGSNPLQPQAGTWIFDRANWCPGELNIPDLIDVPLSHGRGELLRKHVVDIDMEPYVQDSSTAVANICAYAVLYAAPRASHDAAVEEISFPGAGDGIASACLGAQVRIRNQGREPLRTLTIRYGTEGAPFRTFHWEGDLPFGAAAEVALVGAHALESGSGRFEVASERPNGHRDGWTGDDRMTVAFRAPEILPATVVVQLRTNAQPGHNHLRVLDGMGLVVLGRALGSLRADTLYNDTLRLAPGCYTLMLGDTAGDGLEFWYNAKGGRGTLRLLDDRGRLLRSFESDCGNGVYHPFQVGAGITVAPDTLPAIGLFPTRTTGRTVLDFFASTPVPVVVRILDEQQDVVEEHRYAALKEAVLPYDLGHRPPQRYTVKVLISDQEVFTRRLRVESRME